MDLLRFAEGIFEMETLLQFLDYNKFPLVTKLTDTNSVRVYSSPIKLQVAETNHVSVVFSNFAVLCFSLFSYFKY